MEISHTDSDSGDSSSSSFFAKRSDVVDVINPRFSSSISDCVWCIETIAASPLRFATMLEMDDVIFFASKSVVDDVTCW